MAIFVISSTSDDAVQKLAETVAHEIAEADRIRINACTWLVNFSGSAADVADKIGIKKGGIPGFVASAPDIAGMGAKPLADWVNANETGAR